MDRLNNPAAHLTALLKRLCNIPPTNPAREAFAGVLEVNAGDTPALLARIEEMVKLAVRAEEQVRATPKLNVDRYLNWKKEVYEAFAAISLVGNLAPFLQPLRVNGHQALERLQYCADGLERERGSKELQQQELNEIQKEINDLHSEIRQAELDDELKLYLMEQLRLMTEAINQYHLFGLELVQRTANEALGSLMLNPEARHRISKTPLSEKFWRVVERFALVASGLADTMQIVETVRKVLPLR